MASIIGISFVLIKLHYSGIYDFPTLSTDLWYQNLLKDEIDDVSAIFYYNKYFIGIIITLVLISFELFSYKDNNKNQKIYLIFTLVPLYLFFISLIIEIIAIKFNIAILIKPLIQTQIGSKIFGLLLIPLLSLLTSKYILPARNAKTLNSFT